MNYSDYNIEDWITDEAFIAYVNGEHSEDIDRLKNDSKHAENIRQATKIVQNLERTQIKVNPLVIEEIYDKINHSIDMVERPETRIVNMKWVGIAAAAVIVLLIAFPFFMASESNHITTIAEKSTFKLPDSSLVRLNSVSSIRYNQKSWKKHRYLVLEGEAFFDVEEGSKFMVKSTQGIVTVMGTQFNIRDRIGFYEVECVEGKVRVALQEGGSFELEKGDRLTKVNEQEADVKRNAVKEIDWLNDYIEVEDQKLSLVLEEVGRHFKVKFSNIDSLSDKKYTGFFSTNSLDSAVHQIFWPMEVDYEINENKVVIK
ncbi:FecR family protein [Portibacter marinus]|uniref:FecR family protein n=1 Tax=Portibacter marinus TaxID=2898660 RepID=UPI001F21968B|nr:FecR domain-containing protein [Portibacter marinus]